MSRGAGRPGRRPGGAERGATAPARRGPSLRFGLLALAAVAVGALTLWGALRWRPAPPAPPAETTAPALLDSVYAVWLGGDRERALLWTQRWAAAAPRDANALRSLGLAWHNLAWVGAPSARARSATRTALDRMVMERRALALLDSSAALARTPAEWAWSRYWTGMIHENHGLVIDALRIYTVVHMRQPDVTPALSRAAALLGRLRDPRPPAAPVPDPTVLEPPRP